MNFHFLGIFCFVGCLTSCHGESTTIEAEDVEIDDEEPAQEDPEQGPTLSSTPEKDEEDEGFDPCPRVKYLLLERDGIKYYMEMDVPCEPIQNINLGCPSPI